MHFDFLMGGDDLGGSEERDRLFEDEEEDEAALLEAQRMEEIQAALNEIIANEDMSSSQDLRRGASSQDLMRTKPSQDLLRSSSHDHLPNARLLKGTPTPPEVDPLSASVELVRPDRHPLAGNKLTSRSAEDLQSLMGSSTAPSPVRRVSQFDARAVRGARRVRLGSVDMATSSARPTKSIFADEDDDVLGGVPDVPEVDEEGDGGAGGIHQAAPGDMQISIEIGRLGNKITELTQQDALLGQLIRQAELTGNDNELKLLQRSRSSLQREVRTAEFQKRQYEQQEEENRLVPGRTKVDIPRTSLADDEGRQVVRYNVEIRQVEPDGRTRLSWIVTHRYNEFWELDRAIREVAATSNNIAFVEAVRTKMKEIPGKRLVPSLSASFVESRRAGLEKYLQSIIACGPLCDSLLVRNFLSQSSGAVTADLSTSTGSLAALPTHLVKTLYKTVTSSLDEALVPSMFDLMSQSLQRQIYEVAGGIGAVTEVMPSALRGGPWWQSPSSMTAPLPSIASSTLIAGNMAPAIGVGGTQLLQPLDGESAAGSFTAPICDLFIELFDLKENNWLRRQAIVLILQQVLGGTIERKARDTFRTYSSEHGVDKVLRVFQDTMWPGGVRRPPSTPRTEQEKHETRVGASRKLALLMPDVAANMIGRGNARRAAQRVFGALQDTKMNQHLVLSVMDEVSGPMGQLYGWCGADKSRSLARCFRPQPSNDDTGAHL